ncbi:MAG: glycosyltransferase, partial [Candidatus Kapaibacterium sp.]
MLHIIYRSYGGENLKNRPDFYSKLVCLYSFIDSVLMIDEEVKLIFMNDGPIQDDKIEVMKKYGDIISLPSLGNSPSFREALNLALNLSDSDLVYFAEDDYLYKPEAFKNMLLA